MKVSELREKIRSSTKDELQQIIVEMYKQIPKKMREEKEIDRLIENPDAFKKRKNTQRPMENLDFHSIEKETRWFIQNAYEQNYVAPNRLIPKKDRANWRFTAKRLVEQVSSFANHPEHGKTCAALLEELYRLFVYASGHYVFASEEPFDTLRIPQVDFLNRVVLLKKEIEDPDKWISESLNLVLETGVDYQTLTSSLLEVILSTLNNAPLKERMIEIAEKLLLEKHRTAKRSKGRYSDWKDEEYINNLVEMIFITQSALGEYQPAVDIFQKYHFESRDEVKLFILLRLIMEHQSVEIWKQEYERAVKLGVNPREGLKETYDYIKRENEFPEYIFSY
ncbi:hypothetical protein QNH23_10200 [Siminovitchia fortis]|uniref:Uncharacterized protein n=1 Tax=Siminovitchia fortis TaxID=254758 RepID=A0A443IJG1_9BACI|nr:hypothetical protein [Siminovitchia fortis]RWR04475.1 hypothetical protein D4N35_016905 [Siminovitchia fortis]WHY80345.1 hypothetical protein QNH23_10200 [Siminovitchia fortis]